MTLAVGEGAGTPAIPDVSIYIQDRQGTYHLESPTAKTAYEVRQNKVLQHRDKTYLRLRSPSFLKPSMIPNISFRALCASTDFPPMLIPILSPLAAFNSFPNSKCFITTQTKTPQSLLFSCCGASSRSLNISCFPNNLDIFSVANCADEAFEG